jgi:DNA-binding response OmpR family regulator
MIMPKILIADDDRNISELIADCLIDEGFDTVVAADGNAALEAVELGSFDIILLDIMMPGADGLEVCRKIRDKVNCPILFVTARGRTIDTVLGLEIGADDYITKPFVVEELAAKVKAHLRRERRHAEGHIIIA